MLMERLTVDIRTALPALCLGGLLRKADKASAGEETPRKAQAMPDRKTGRNVSERTRATLLLAATALLWSSGGLAIKLVDLPPMAITGARAPAPPSRWPAYSGAGWTSAPARRGCWPPCATAGCSASTCWPPSSPPRPTPFCWPTPRRLRGAAGPAPVGRKDPPLGLGVRGHRAFRHGALLPR